MRAFNYNPYNSSAIIVNTQENRKEDEIGENNIEERKGVRYLSLLKQDDHINCQSLCLRWNFSCGS